MNAGPSDIRRICRWHRFQGSALARTCGGSSSQLVLANHSGGADGFAEPRKGAREPALSSRWADVKDQAESVTVRAVCAKR